jgi:hypothetical protein
MKGQDPAMSSEVWSLFTFEVCAHGLGGVLEHHQARFTLFLVRISIRLIIVGDLPQLVI